MKRRYRRYKKYKKRINISEKVELVGCKHAKIKQAAALRYDPENNFAPELVAKGTGYIAEKIIEKAKESNVPIYHDENLVATLNAMDLGEEIPPELYGVVAEILVFVSDLDKKYGERYGVYRKEE